MASFSTDARLEDVLSSMLNDHNHMALVIDQFENWVGIITLEDIIETILGKEIVDETDQVADMRLYAKLKWKRKRAERHRSGGRFRRIKLFPASAGIFFLIFLLALKASCRTYLCFVKLVQGGRHGASKCK